MSESSESLKPTIIPGLATQFRPGHPGHPNAGRPKKPVTSALRKWANHTKLAKNPITGKIEPMTQMELAAIAILQKAQKGNVLAFMEIADRLEGKATQRVEVEQKKLIVAKVIGLPGMTPPDYNQRKELE